MFKNYVDFLISSNMSLQFYFFRIKVTLQYASYLCLKNIPKIFLKNLNTWQYFGDMTFENRYSI